MKICREYFKCLFFTIIMNQTNKNEFNKKKFVIRVEGKHAFQRGDTFETFEEVAERLHAHTLESLVYYWIRDSRLVKFAHTKVSRKIDEKLQYYSIKFSCIFGGQRFKSKANGLRPCKRQTRQIDCPAFISLRATKCGSKLEVIDVCNDHTHEISEQAVEELPQKRRPSQSLLEEIHELLHLNVDKKLIIEYVKQKENKNILKKDLFNMATHLRLGLPRTRSVEEQKSILHRITQTATADAIQQVVHRTLLHINGKTSEIQAIFHEPPKLNSHSIDVFNGNTTDFTALAPEIDLLNTANDTKAHMDYDELLSNQIVVSFENGEIKPQEVETTNNSLHDNKWNSETSDSRIVYKDFICGDNESYTYDELELRKEDVKQDGVHLSTPSSPVSNHPHDIVDDKEYFNDLILISPSGEMCSSDVSMCHVGHSSEEEIPIEGYDMDKEAAANEDSHIKHTHDLIELPFSNPRTSVKMNKSYKSPKHLARRTRRMIINCRNCGVNARLINMQISYLKQQRRKLVQETEVLKLRKQKLQAEIRAIKDNGSL